MRVSRQHRMVGVGYAHFPSLERQSTSMAGMGHPSASCTCWPGDEGNAAADSSRALTVSLVVLTAVTGTRILATACAMLGH
jgi:hypothetical protein